jgi:hypothetical protein
VWFGSYVKGVVRMRVKTSTYAKNSPSQGRTLEANVEIKIICDEGHANLTGKNADPGGPNEGYERDVLVVLDRKELQTLFSSCLHRGWVVLPGMDELRAASESLALAMKALQIPAGGSPSGEGG